MPMRYSKVPSRTKINTEYMPWLEEDEIESHDPLEVERNTDTRDIIKEDAERFRKLCKKHGFNFTKLNKEYERKQKLLKPLQEKLSDAKQRLDYAEHYNWSQAKRKRLSKEISKLETEIKNITNE